MGRELISNVVTRWNFRNHLAKPKPLVTCRNQSPEWFNVTLKVTQLGEKARNSSILVQDALYYIMLGKTGENPPNRRWMLSKCSPFEQNGMSFREGAWGGRASPQHCPQWWGITANRGKDLRHSSLARTRLHLSLASGTKGIFLFVCCACFTLAGKKQQQQQEKREPRFKN